MQGLPAVVAILQVPAYQTALLEGLAASIGGLDSSLSKAASAAVLHLIAQQPSSGEKQGVALQEQIEQGGCIQFKWQVQQ